MVKIVEKHQQNKKTKEKRGNDSKFSSEDKVLILLKYYREYVTQFSIGADLGVHETTVGRIIREVEEILIKSQKFSLPGKKVLRNDMGQFEVILVDATEQAIERPKKDRVKKGKKN